MLLRMPTDLGQRLLVAGLALVYAVLLQYAYSTTGGLWAYMGYRVSPLGPEWFLVALLAVALTAFVLPRRLSSPSSVIVWIHYILLVAPVLALTPVIGDLPLYPLVALAVSHVVAHVVWCVIASDRAEKVDEARLGSVPWALVLGIWLVSVAIAVAAFRTGFVRPTISSDIVYDLRGQFRDTLQSRGRWVGYVLFPIVKVINPLAICFAYYTKRWWMVIGGVVFQIYLFGVSGHKSTLAVVVFVGVALLLFRSSVRGMAVRMMAGAAAGLALATMANLGPFATLRTLGDLVVRRLLATPALMAVEYFRFFTENPVAQFGGTLPVGILSPPYDRTVPMLVGSSVFGSQTMSANTGVIASAFAELGEYGVLLVIVGFGALLKALDVAARPLSTVLWAPAVAVWAWTITETSLQTALVTHGGAVLVGMLFLTRLTSGSKSLSGTLRGRPEERGGVWPEGRLAIRDTPP